MNVNHDGPHWFTLPEDLELRLPAHLRDAEDEARHFIDSVSRKLVRRDVDENGFAHLHSVVLNRTIRHRNRAPIIKALLGQCIIEASPHRSGKYSRGYRLTDELLGQEPRRAACHDLALIHRIRSEQERLDAEQRCRWLPIHESLASDQRCLTVTAAADTILSSLEPQTRFCQRILLNNIRNGQHSFSVSRWGRCFNALCGIKRELRPALRIDDQPVTALDIRCAQPALLALMIGVAYPPLGLFRRTTYKVAPVVAPFLPAVLPGSSSSALSEFGRYRDLVCDGSFNEWLVLATGLPRDEAKRRFLIDVLAKSGRYPSEVEQLFRSQFPNIHGFLRSVRNEDYRTTIRALQRLESWLVIEKVAPRLIGRVPFVTLHDAIYCRSCDLPLVGDAFEETFEEIGFRLALKPAS